MLNAKCMICTWVKALLSSCQYAPSLHPGQPLTVRNGGAGDLAGLETPPADRTQPVGPERQQVDEATGGARRWRTVSHTNALIPIRTDVVRPGLPGRSPPYAVRPLRVAFAPSATHVGSGATAASRMQSGQIVRSQRWHRMYDSRPGCR